MRWARLFLVSAIFAASAFAAKPLDGKATAASPYEGTATVRVERLRVRHFAGPVVIVPSEDDQMRVRVDETANLPAATGRWLSRTPAIHVVLEEVSRGNFVLTTEAPEGATKAELEPEPAPFFTAGPGVSFGTNVTIGGDEGRPTPAVDPTARATRATLVVEVPTRFFRHLSVVTAFGDVTIRDFRFPKPVGDEEEYANVFHGKTGRGKVRLEGVRHVRFLAPSRNFSTKAGCAASIETNGHEEKLDRLFR